MILLFLIEPIDDKENSNEMSEPRQGMCKKDSDCPQSKICRVNRILTSYICVEPDGNPKSPKQGIKIKFRSSSYSTFFNNLYESGYINSLFSMNRGHIQAYSSSMLQKIFCSDNMYWILQGREETWYGNERNTWGKFLYKIRRQNRFLLEVRC